jgi:hypothetical protein
MEKERTEIIILLESIKENIMHNPDLGYWQGILISNSKKYHWRVTEKPINFTVEGKE